MAHTPGAGRFPGSILEALEAVAAVPLPARCGFWAVGEGVAVEVAVPEDTPAVRAALQASLQAQAVPLAELHLTTDPSALRRPLPWRGDLHEASFAG